MDLFITLSLLLLCIRRSASASFNPACTEGGNLFIVAHPDDDLLFQSPNLIKAMSDSHTTQTCTTIIYLTSGDAGHGWSPYAAQRERGSDAAHASMLTHLLVYFDDLDAHKVNLTARLRTAVFPFQHHAPAVVRAFAGFESTHRIYFRFPDGFSSGAGFPATKNTSLRKLYEGTIDAIDTIDALSPWTLSDLRSALQEMVLLFRPRKVHLQDWFTDDADIGPNNEHADHVFGARIGKDAVELAVAAARDGYEPLVWSYVGYKTQAQPPDLHMLQGHVGPFDVEDALAWKTEAFYAYAGFDDELSCREMMRCEEVNDIYWIWLQRQYWKEDGVLSSRRRKNGVGHG